MFKNGIDGFISNPVLLTIPVFYWLLDYQGVV